MLTVKRPSNRVKASAARVKFEGVVGGSSGFNSLFENINLYRMLTTKRPSNRVKASASRVKFKRQGTQGPSKLLVGPVLVGCPSIILVATSAPDHMSRDLAERSKKVKRPCRYEPRGHDRGGVNRSRGLFQKCQEVKRFGREEVAKLSKQELKRPESGAKRPRCSVKSNLTIKEAR